jgi:hypothetical protein
MLWLATLLLTVSVCLSLAPKIATWFATAQPGVRQPTHPNQISRSQKSSSFNSICDLWRIPSQLPTAGARYLWHWKSVPPPLAPPAASYFGDLCHSTPFPPPTSLSLWISFQDHLPSSAPTLRSRRDGGC